MPRVYSRELPDPDVMSEQTHDDCEWLNEEDGKQNVLRNWRGWNRRDGSPTIAKHESRDARRQNDGSAENGA
jgi:hypothetical protein